MFYIVISTAKCEVMNAVVLLSLTSIGIVVSYDQPQSWYMEDNDFLSYMNTSVNPCDDFYEYTCGNFKNVHPLRSGDMTIDHFTLLEENITNVAKEILSSKIKDDDPVALRKAKSAYSACTNYGFLNSLKDPEMSIIKDENGYPLVQTKQEREHVKFGWNDIGKFVSKYGVQMIFTVEAYSNLEDPTKNLIMLSTDNLANPGLLRPYIELKHEEIIEKSLAEYSKGYLTNARKEALPFDIYLKQLASKTKAMTMSRVSDDEVQDNIDRMGNFMRGVYFGGYISENDTVIPMNISKTTVTLKQLNDWTKLNFGNRVQIDWVDYMKNVFRFTGTEITEDTDVLYYNGIERMLYKMLNMVNLEHPSTVKDFAMTRTFLYMAPDGDLQSRTALEEYYKKIKMNIVPREKYCTRKVIDAIGTAGLSFAVAYEYQLRHFNVNSFSRAARMIEHLQASFKEMLQKSSWMDNQSKELALKKLDNMITTLGYPDVAHQSDKLDRFYENLRICKWDNFGNAMTIRAFKLAYQLSQVAKRDRAFWDKSPFEVNAYYNRPNNKIIFPVAILNPIFFGSQSSILDYARIGSIIGHEITHGFDMQGAMYDEDCRMLPWWTAETRKSFLNKTQCFIEQYSKYYVAETNSYINASTTLNENIADNGGIRESYRAMKKLPSSEHFNTKYGDFTMDQLFFVGFGSMWCNNPSMEYSEMMKTNEHAASRWRVNGVVSNMPEFAKAFNCPLESAMNPEQKCILW